MQRLYREAVLAKTARKLLGEFLRLRFVEEPIAAYEFLKPQPLLVQADLPGCPRTGRLYQRDREIVARVYDHDFLNVAAGNMVAKGMEKFNAMNRLIRRWIAGKWTGSSK